MAQVPCTVDAAVALLLSASAPQPTPAARPAEGSPQAGDRRTHALKALSCLRSLAGAIAPPRRAAAPRQGGAAAAAAEALTEAARGAVAAAVPALVAAAAGVAQLPHADGVPVACFLGHTLISVLAAHPEARKFVDRFFT